MTHEPRRHFVALPGGKGKPPQPPMVQGPITADFFNSDPYPPNEHELAILNRMLAAGITIPLFNEPGFWSLPHDAERRVKAFDLAERIIDSEGAT